MENWNRSNFNLKIKEIYFLLPHLFRVFSFLVPKLGLGMHGSKLRLQKNAQRNCSSMGFQAELGNKEIILTRMELTKSGKSTPSNSPDFNSNEAHE